MSRPYLPPGAAPPQFAPFAQGANGYYFMPYGMAPPGMSNGLPNGMGTGYPNFGRPPPPPLRPPITPPHHLAQGMMPPSPIGSDRRYTADERSYAAQLNWSPSGPPPRPPFFPSPNADPKAITSSPASMNGMLPYQNVTNGMLPNAMGRPGYTIAQNSPQLQYSQAASPRFVPSTNAAAPPAAPQTPPLPTPPTPPLPASTPAPYGPRGSERRVPRPLPLHTQNQNSSPASMLPPPPARPVSSSPTVKTKEGFVHPSRSGQVPVSPNLPRLLPTAPVAPILPAPPQKRTVEAASEPNGIPPRRAASTTPLPIVPSPIRAAASTAAKSPILPKSAVSTASTAPASSPIGNLSSLAKLQKFKAQVEASRLAKASGSAGAHQTESVKNTLQPDLTPTKIAFAAESFLAKHRPDSPTPIRPPKSTASTVTAAQPATIHRSTPVKNPAYTGGAVRSSSSSSHSPIAVLGDREQELKERLRARQKAEADAGATADEEERAADRRDAWTSRGQKRDAREAREEGEVTPSIPSAPFSPTSPNTKRRRWDEMPVSSKPKTAEDFVHASRASYANATAPPKEPKSLRDREKEIRALEAKVVSPVRETRRLEPVEAVPPPKQPRTSFTTKLYSQERHDHLIIANALQPRPPSATPPANPTPPQSYTRSLKDRIGERSISPVKRDHRCKSPFARDSRSRSPRKRDHQDSVSRSTGETRGRETERETSRNHNEREIDARDLKRELDIREAIAKERAADSQGDSLREYEYEREKARRSWADHRREVDAHASRMEQDGRGRQDDRSRYASPPPPAALAPAPAPAPVPATLPTPAPVQVAPTALGQLVDTTVLETLAALKAQIAKLEALVPAAALVNTAATLTSLLPQVPITPAKVETAQAPFDHTPISQAGVGFSPDHPIRDDGKHAFGPVKHYARNSHAASSYRTDDGPSRSGEAEEQKWPREIPRREERPMTHREMLGFHSPQESKRTELPRDARMPASTPSASRYDARYGDTRYNKTPVVSPQTRKSSFGGGGGGGKRGTPSRGGFAARGLGGGAHGARGGTRGGGRGGASRGGGSARGRGGRR